MTKKPHPDFVDVEVMLTADERERLDLLTQTRGWDAESIFILGLERAAEIESGGESSYTETKKSKS